MNQREMLRRILEDIGVYSVAGVTPTSRHLRLKSKSVYKCSYTRFASPRAVIAASIRRLLYQRSSRAVKPMSWHTRSSRVDGHAEPGWAALEYGARQSRRLAMP